MYWLDLGGFLAHEREAVLSKALRDKLFGEKMFADVVIEVQGEEIPAHKCILAATCQYFNDLFTSPMEDSSSPRLPAPRLLNDTQPSPETFRTFLHLLYGGPLPSSPVTCALLLPLADYYRCDHLTTALYDVIVTNLTPHNVCEIATHADSYGLPELTETCVHFTVANYKESLPTLSALPSHLKDRIMQGIIPKMAK
eukprot:TRINITY_DN48668_c0_g1_i1.p1 TRINITY_DN48668_c0_g1~~TRINITY_DN48668_c0_g1_i1.p1  ORF type:complete len:206 (+),score=28.52 TRINITY_DN48668_c0_g1_i1:28-618(+)